MQLNNSKIFKNDHIYKKTYELKQLIIFAFFYKIEKIIKNKYKKIIVQFRSK